MPDSKRIEPAFFDLETQKGFDEVDNDFTKLGFSVAVVRQTRNDYVYRGDDESGYKELIAHLKRAPLIVGHNIIAFDYTVLRGYGLSSDEVFELESKSYDTLALIYDQIQKRISLDHLSKHNLPGSPGKLAPGEMCIEWYKTGQIKKITELCTDDVHRIKGIFARIVTGQPLRILKYWESRPDKFTPMKRMSIRLPIPTGFEQYVRKTAPAHSAR